ncbi:MAG: TRAP transporter small permease subunit [Chloroflexota bacterium]|nr:TRAP transporter small permease subunit [Chloroflexota bacterium]
MSKAGKVFDRILGGTVFLAGAILIFDMLAVSADVAMRNLFNAPLAWQVDVTEASLVFIPFLGTAWVLKKEGHVIVDTLVNLLKPKPKALLNLVTSMLATVAVIPLFWYGVQVTWEAYRGGYHPRSVIEIPDAAVLWIIPVGSILLFIQFLRRNRTYFNSSRGKAVSQESRETKTELT